jgi:hypothetical protein
MIWRIWDKEMKTMKVVNFKIKQNNDIVVYMQKTMANTCASSRGKT